MKTLMIVLLGIVFISLIIGLCIYANQKIIYDFEGVKIKKSNFDTISETFGSSSFNLCNLQENKCTRIKLIRLEKDGE